MEDKHKKNDSLATVDSGDLETAEPVVFDKAKKKKSKSFLPAIIIAAVAIVAVAGIAVYFIVSNANKQAVLAAQQAEEEEREKLELAIAQNEEYDSIVNSSVFLDGVTVNGISVAGLTMEEAQTLLEENFGTGTMSGTVKLICPAEYEASTLPADIEPEEDESGTATQDLGEEPEDEDEQSADATDDTVEAVVPAQIASDNTCEFDLSIIGVSSNITEVLTQAFKLARTGSQESVLAEAQDIRENGRDFELSVNYDFSAVPAQVDALADTLDRPVENEAIGNLDLENHTVEIIAGQPGITVDRDALTEAIENAVSAGDTETAIEVPYSLIPVDETNHKEYIYTTMTTSFKGSSSNRIYNITKGAGLINGTVLKPGEVFSTNNTLGQRTTKNGWKLAHAYVNGTTEEQAGGGVCQLSSTLYNAVVMADLEIVHRQNHSMKVSYVSQGLDATINSVGNMIDFSFKNDTDGDVVIFAWTSGKTVTMKVYRTAFDTEKHGFDFDEIRLTSEKVSTISPKGDWVITVDNSKAAGYEEITQERKNGSVWQSYKHYYLNGKEVKTEKLDSSTYKAYPGAKIVGPEAEATPTPTQSSNPTPTPTPTPSDNPTPTATPAQGSGGSDSGSDSGNSGSGSNSDSNS